MSLSNLILKRQTFRLTFAELRAACTQNIYIFIIMNLLSPGSSPKREPVVGALLVHQIESGPSFKLATWYRRVGDQLKIVKMQRIKEEASICYRCTVYDTGAFIELRLQNDSKQERFSFGPVKFDSYLNKQLEDNKNLHCAFNANIHLKIGQTVPVKVRTIVNEQRELEFHIETKKETDICFSFPLLDDWRKYEEVFNINDVKLTDVCIRQNLKQYGFKQKLRQLNLNLDFRNYFVLTFSNVVQRNIFLARIIKKVIEQEDLPRNSQLKSVANSEHKNHMENEIDDLFKSGMSSNFFTKNSLVSEKVYSQMKDVVFTPSQDNQQLIEKGGFTYSNFDQFLNPEQQKIQQEHKLSQIAQEQTEFPDKSTTNIERFNRSADHLEATKKIKPIGYQIRDNGQQGANNWNQLICENQGLRKQNIFLKSQNKQLRKKVFWCNKNHKTRPYEERREKSSQHQVANKGRVKSYKNSMNSLQRNKSENFKQQKQAFIEWKQRFSFLKKKNSKTLLKNTKKCEHHASSNVSMSTKTVKLHQRKNDPWLIKLVQTS